MHKSPDVWGNVFIRFISTVSSHSSANYFKQKRSFGPRQITRPRLKRPAALKKPSEINPPPYKRVLINRVCNIIKYSRSWDSAQKELEGMLHIRWDSYTITQVLKQHPPLNRALHFFNWAKTLPKFKHDQFTYTTMIDLLGEAGRIDQMKALLQEMGEPGLRTDCVTYTTVMHRLAETGDVDGAIQAWKSMRLDKCQPTVVSYTEYIRILLKKGRPEEAAGVYREMLATGIQPNCHTYTVLIEYLADQGKFEEAFGILDEMKNLRIEPSKATFNILVEKCAKAGKTNLINEILLLMRYLGHVLRLPIFLKALEAFEKAGETTDVLRAVHPHLCYVSPCSRNPHFVNDDNNDKLALLIDVNMIWYLLRYKSLLAIKIMLEEMLLAGVALSNAVLSTIIKECSFKEEVATAMIAYKYCKTLDIQLDRDAYASLVGLLLRNRSFESTVQVCNDMIEKGVKPGSYVLTVLIKRLGHAGLSDTAEKLFEALTSEHNVATYTGLIEVFMNSTTTTDKALGLFLRMKRHGVRPARGTYTVLQLGLEKACRYQEANKFRQHRVMLRTGFLNSKNMELEEDYYETLCNLLFDSDSHVYGLDIRQVTNSTFVGPKSSNVNEIH